MEPFTWTFLDLGGGHNGGLRPSHIADREFARLYNFYTFGPHLYYRRGVRPLIDPTRIEPGAPVSDSFTSLFASRVSGGDWTLILGRKLGFSRLDGIGSTVIPLLDFSLASDDFPWSFSQYLNIIYASRRNAGSLIRLTTASAQRAGIPSPAVAPVLADGSAGDVVAGDYLGVYTFYNTETGAESNYSEPSNVLSAAGSKEVDWSNVDISTNPQVNARRLYRTLINRTGEYFFVGMISDNSSTTFSENVTANSIGDVASASNGVPPATVKLHAIWDERMFTSDGRTVRYSGLGMMESYDELDEIEVNTDDGHDITALFGIPRRFIIGKSGSMHYLSPAGDGGYDLDVLDEEHGIRAPHSIRYFNGQVMWYSGSEFRRSTGGPSEDVKPKQIRDILDDIPEDRKEYLVAAVLPELNWYACVVPQTTGPSKVIVWDWVNESWSVFTHPYSPVFLGDFFNSAGTASLYACVEDDDRVYAYNSGGYFFDFYPGQHYDGIIRSKAFDGGRPGFEVAVHRASLQLADTPLDYTYVTEPDQVDLRLYRNLSLTPCASRSISLYRPADGPWHRYTLGQGRGRRGQMIQVELRYATARALIVEGIQLEGTLYAMRKQAG